MLAVYEDASRGVGDPLNVADESGTTRAQWVEFWQGLRADFERGIADCEHAHPELMDEVYWRRTSP